MNYMEFTTLTICVFKKACLCYVRDYGFLINAKSILLSILKSNVTKFSIVTVHSKQKHRNHFRVFQKTMNFID